MNSKEDNFLSKNHLNTLLNTNPLDSINSKDFSSLKKSSINLIILKNSNNLHVMILLIIIIYSLNQFH